MNEDMSEENKQLLKSIILLCIFILFFIMSYVCYVELFSSDNIIIRFMTSITAGSILACLVMLIICILLYSVSMIIYIIFRIFWHFRNNDS